MELFCDKRCQQQINEKKKDLTHTFCSDIALFFYFR